MFSVFYWQLLERLFIKKFLILLLKLISISRFLCNTQSKINWNEFNVKQFLGSIWFVNLKERKFIFIDN